MQTQVLTIEALSRSFRMRHLAPMFHALMGTTTILASGEFALLRGADGTGCSRLLRTLYRSYLPQRLPLLDEPTASLNNGTRRRFIDRLEELERNGLPMIGALRHPGHVAPLIDRKTELGDA